MRQVLDDGPVAGYPVQDVRVIVYDGKHHDVDSKEVAFITAGKRAFMDAIGKARADHARAHRQHRDHRARAQHGRHRGRHLVQARPGHRHRLASRPARSSIKGKVPLSELNNYQARLKSVTAGQGSYTIEFSHYDPVPPNVQKDLVAAHAKTAQAEEE